MNVFIPSSSFVFRLWLVLFGFWLFFLSGIPAGLTHSPGMLQSFRLKKLLASKVAQGAKMEKEIHLLDTERTQLEKNRMVQEREIRRVLGYAASDEIIFDFSAADRLGE
jgi:cell division protein FtsB